MYEVSPPQYHATNGRSEPELPPRDPPGKTAAVIAIHGMSQELRGTTLATAAEALRRVDEEKHGPSPHPVVSRTVKLGSETLQRMELKVRSKDGVQDVHVYETYWAPITEGAINLRGVMGFLRRAGVTGIRRTWNYKRWLFGRPVDFNSVIRGARPLLIFTLLTLFGLMIINALTVVAAASLAAPDDWIHPGLVRDVTAIQATVLGAAIVFGGVMWLPLLARGRLRRALSIVGLWVFYGLCGTIILAAAASVYVLFHDFTGNSFLDGGAATTSDWTYWIIVWGLLTIASYFARKWVVSYVGDVAIYVESQSLDAYDAKRREIKNTANRVFQAVYGARDEKSHLIYGNVAIVGHSLGSVIAYDALNFILHEETARPLYTKVRSRTSVFLTFGSPLDKTALLFAAQERKNRPGREVIAASSQPLIEDEDYRSIPWVNVFADTDIVSSQLSLYDDRLRPQPDEKRVLNIRDPDCVVPLKCHLDYWSQPTTWDILHDRVTHNIAAGRFQFPQAILDMVEKPKAQKRVETANVTGQRRRN